MLNIILESFNWIVFRLSTRPILKHKFIIIVFLLLVIERLISIMFLGDQYIDVEYQTCWQKSISQILFRADLFQIWNFGNSFHLFIYLIEVCKALVSFNSVDLIEFVSCDRLWDEKSDLDRFILLDQNGLVLKMVLDLLLHELNGILVRFLFSLLVSWILFLIRY